MCDEDRTFCRGCAFCRRAGHGGIRPRMSRRAGDCRSSFSTCAIMSLTTRPTARSMKHTARRTPRVSRASRSTKPITRGLENLHAGVHDELPGTWHSHYDEGGYGSGYSAPRYYAPAYSYGYRSYAPVRYTYVYRRPVHHRRVVYYAPY